MFNTVFNRRYAAYSTKARAAYNCWSTLNEFELDDEEFEYVLEELKQRRISKKNRIRQKELTELARLKAKYESEE